MSLTNRIDRQVDTLELDKWLATSEFIINRKEGRDILCYEILHRALRELRWRRKIERALLQAVADVSDRISGMDSSQIRAVLKELLPTIKGQVTFPPEMQKDPVKWDPAHAKELAQSDVLHEINENILKPKGFVLILHYEPKDLGKEKPISATFEVWKG